MNMGYRPPSPWGSTGIMSTSHFQQEIQTPCVCRCPERPCRRFWLIMCRRVILIAFRFCLLFILVKVVNDLVSASTKRNRKNNAIYGKWWLLPWPRYELSFDADTQKLRLEIWQRIALSQKDTRRAMKGSKGKGGGKSNPKKKVSKGHSRLVFGPTLHWDRTQALQQGTRALTDCATRPRAK